MGIEAMDFVRRLIVVTMDEKLMYGRDFVGETGLGHGVGWSGVGWDLCVEDFI